MTLASFIDANIPIYAAGGPNPLKAPRGQILLLIAENPAAFVTDAEVLQEILHRYLAIRRWADGRRVFDEFELLMLGRVEPMYAVDVAHAVALAVNHADLFARDLVHAAVMARLGVTQIITADRGFDRLPEIERLDPASFESWREKISGQATF